MLAAAALVFVTFTASFATIYVLFVKDASHPAVAAPQSPETSKKPALSPESLEKLENAIRDKEGKQVEIDGKEFTIEIWPAEEDFTKTTANPDTGEKVTVTTSYERKDDRLIKTVTTTHSKSGRILKKEVFVNDIIVERTMYDNSGKSAEREEFNKGKLWRTTELVRDENGNLIYRLSKYLPGGWH